MRAGVFMAEETIAQLRRQIARIEANVAFKSDTATREALPVPGMATASSRLTASAPATLAPRRGATKLSFDHPRLDALLGGGLPRAALHEMRVAESRDTAAMTGFAIALLARIAHDDARPLLWIVERAVGAETGLPYGGGLRTFGNSFGAQVPNFNKFTVYASNPFLPASVRDVMTARGITSFQYSASRQVDLGSISSRNRTDSMQGNIGAKGAFKLLDTDWAWNADLGVGAAAFEPYIKNTPRTADFFASAYVVTGPNGHSGTYSGTSSAD